LVEAQVGQPIDQVLRGRALNVRVRMVSHRGDVVRLYVIQDTSTPVLFGN
jgi:hypothetical protein